MTKNGTKQNYRGRMPDGSPNPIDLHVGRRMRSRRELLGLSQEFVGQKIGLSFQQIQKYELGKSRICASRLWDISNVLDINLLYFFEEMDEQTLKNSPRKLKNGDDYPDEMLPSDILNKEISLKVLRAYYRLSNSLQQTLYNLMLNINK